MSYLKEFLTQIHQRDFQKFLVLWEEYVMGDTIEFDEFSQLLRALKNTEVGDRFGRMAETALPLWEKIENKDQSYEILRLLVDLQTTYSPLITEHVNEALSYKYGKDPKFNERIKMIGFRNKENFQGVLSKYDLLNHMKKNNIVFHLGGWGTGEIIDVSFVSENLVIEFENVSGKKDLSFDNAFKTLIPLPSSHFLARRFADPDKLEKEAKEDPVFLIKLLLADVGPKTAAEIKDEICELIIPEQDWVKWWQGARSKLKKEPYIQTPDTLKEPFHLRQSAITSEDKIREAFKHPLDNRAILQTIYSFVRDTQTALKNAEIKTFLKEKLEKLIEDQSVGNSEKLEALYLLEQFFDHDDAKNQINELIASHTNLEKTILDMEIIALKKRALVSLKEVRSDWADWFLKFLASLSQAPLRDYIVKELSEGEARVQLEKRLKSLLRQPLNAPELFVWYFQKIVTGDDEKIPYQSQKGREEFFEAFFVLLYSLENLPEYRDLLKKMYNLLTAKRYALIREFLKGTSITYVKEILLLASKCHTLSDQDKTIFRSLAEVVHPTLESPKHQKEDEEETFIWTTEAGYLKIQDRIRHIGTIEVVENAKEIEAARALGDLRENSEFKFAQERRARLQSELKTLSDQLNKARILTPDDIHQQEIGIGSKVDLEDGKGEVHHYVILGPWDANIEENILSFNSRFAQSMVGKKQGETFSFRDETYKVLKIESFLKD